MEKSLVTDWRKKKFISLTIRKKEVKLLGLFFNKIFKFKGDFYGERWIDVCYPLSFNRNFNWIFA
jgi:hypothetical protein